MQATGAQTWLKALAIVLIGFGAITAIAAFPPLAGPGLLLVDLIFWPIDASQSLAAPETRLLCAISGGVLVGWGATLWIMATRLLGKDPALVRTIVLASVGSWFIVDSIGSVAAGAPLNILFNVGFLVAFLFPVWRQLPAAAPVAER